MTFSGPRSRETHLVELVDAEGTATEWFVAQGGSGSGSQAAPFGKIQSALNVAQPQDQTCERRISVATCFAANSSIGRPALPPERQSPVSTHATRSSISRRTRAEPSASTTRS